MIKYLGSKRTLLPVILGAVGQVARGRTILDPFSGTARVGHALKAAGFRVLANDYNAYAATLARCYVAADREDVEKDATKLVAEFNGLAGRAGWFTATFCERSRFFQPKNGERIDAIRNAMEAKGLPPELESVLMVALMEAADRVDSTTGVQMAYLKAWAARAEKDIQLRVPDVLPRSPAGKGAAFCGEASTFAASHAADVVYLDPPYNQHSYLGNYHVWESLVRWDKPEVYGVACKRVDCRRRRSDFNSRPRFRDAFRALLASLRTEAVVVSFSDEGYLPREDMETLLRERFPEGDLKVIASDYKRYVGAQIGIHSPTGKKVGVVSHLRNQEFTYIATRRADS